jgi:hypothetical protein
MMFETGVTKFIRGVATVENFFPVDLKGNPDLSCNQCKFYDRVSKCRLNGELVNYPKYLGAHCPLYFEELN